MHVQCSILDWILTPPPQFSPTIMLAAFVTIQEKEGAFHRHLATCVGRMCAVVGAVGVWVVLEDLSVDPD